MRMSHIDKWGLSSALLAAGIALLGSTPASAQVATVTGQLLRAEGHEMPTCRRFQLLSDSGATSWFRLPDTGADNSILSVGLTALTAGKRVQITYDPAVTTGCGTEPKVLYIAILAD